MNVRHLAAAAQTEQLGAALALSCPWSETDARCIFLHGPLGAGKTTVVRGLLRALGEERPVGQVRQCIVERLVGQLRLQRLALLEVATHVLRELYGAEC